MDNNQNIVVPADSSVDQSAGSGSRSLAGYDYQIDVSIWLALDLMLSSDMTQILELEPASEEDLEAQLAEYEPGRGTTCARLDKYTLVVQVKLRSGNAWTIPGINRLLQHGSDTRDSVVKRLAKDPTVRYLLVTSAPLNGLAKNLEISNAGSWPQKPLPDSTANILPQNSTGRVAVIGNLDQHRLVLDIRRLLIERFGVPNSRWEECLQVLRREAGERVRRVGNGLWRKDELADVIRKHDGYLASSPDLEDYVHPQNWHALRTAMGPPCYAAIIIGASGTGKTFATRKLYEELHLDNPGLTRVPIHSPRELRDDQTPPPVLYDIEDPWGRYKSDSNSQDWSDELSRYMSKARADRMIIATSRQDIAEQAGAKDSVEQWIFPLEAEHYGTQERQRLFRARLKYLPRDLHLLAGDAEGQVLNELSTPLEIDKFFDALRTMERPKKNQERSFISNAIAQAHKKSIEHTVIQQIKQRGEVCAAAILWAFLKANNNCSLKTLRDLGPDLAERLPALERGVMPLVDFFIAARNLRLKDGELSYYHPRVEAGIEDALKSNEAQAINTLRGFLDVITEPDGPEECWRAGIATRAVAAAKQLLGNHFTLKTKKTVEAIDTWISNSLDDPSNNLSQHLKLAAEAGSSGSNAAEFSRYLLHTSDDRTDRRYFGGFHFWSRPNHPETWYQRLRADKFIAVIAGRFIREMLPDSHIHYNKEFIGDLERLSSDLTPAYLDAASEIVSYGYISSAEVIAKGALRDIDGFEPILDKALNKVTPSEKAKAEAEELHLALVNDVYNSDYAEYLSDNDDGYTANEFLEAYADHIREVTGWRCLVQHRHASRLLPYWMRSLKNTAETNPITADELVGVFVAAYTSKEERTLWDVLKKHWDERYLNQLLSRLCEGSPDSGIRRSSLMCLVAHKPELLTSIVHDLRQTGKHERLVELMIDLTYIQNRRAFERDIYDAAATAAMTQLEPELQELCNAIDDSTDSKQPLSKAVISLLNSSVSSSMSVRMLRIRRFIDLPGTIRPDIEWVLANSSDKDDCVKAIEAAISLGLQDIINTALGHRFAHVVAKALTSVGKNVPAPLPPNLLALAQAKGSPVRTALVQLLSSKPHPDHLPALLNLVQDNWSSSSHSYSDNNMFPIARSAVEAIGKVELLDPTFLKPLQKIALKTSDWMVRKGLFAIIAAQGGCTFQEKILELSISLGRNDVQSAAAYAMLASIDMLDMTIIGKISTDILETQEAEIAAILTLIVAYRASLHDCIDIARTISANPKRRGLLLLMLHAREDSCETFALAIKELLPEGHPSIEWVNAGCTEYAEDALICDLGDPAICSAILHLLNHRAIK